MIVVQALISTLCPPQCKLNNDLKEEIERKRLAAIKRRNEKSQLKEEIERKRQAAIKRRNEKSQQ